MLAVFNLVNLVNYLFEGYGHPAINTSREVAYIRKRSLHQRSLQYGLNLEAVQEVTSGPYKVVKKITCFSYFTPS